MADPVSLIQQSDPSKDAIRILEQVLADAKAGRVRAVAIATVDHEGMTDGVWSQPPFSNALVGAIEALKFRFCYAWLIR